MSPVQLLIVGNIVNVDTTNGPVTIILPNIANSNIIQYPRLRAINDTGNNAETNNITLQASGDSINDGASFVMNVNGQTVALQAIGSSEWLASSSASGSGPTPPPSGNSGENYEVLPTSGTQAENGAALLAAYAAAKLKTPNGNALSASNRYTIILPPGQYLMSETLTMDTDFIDIVSQSGNPDAVLYVDTNGVDPFQFNGITFDITSIVKCIYVTANNILLKGIQSGIVSSPNWIDWSGFGAVPFKFPIDLATDRPLAIFENILTGPCAFGMGFTLSPTSYILSSTFKNVEGSYYCFGNYISDIPGTFIDCIAERYSFGYGCGTIFGIYRGCYGSGTARGLFAFEAEDNEGTYIRCTAGLEGFGYNAVDFGNYYFCTGGSNCYGSANEFAGYAYYCTANTGFGNNGVLNAILYYCKLLGGDFETVGPFGKTVYCIDGSDTPNNQT